MPQRGRNWHVLGVAIAACFVAGCLDRLNPGPLHRCSVVDIGWTEYVGPGCPCSDGDPDHWVTHITGTWSGVVAPPGSFAPSRPIVVRDAEGPVRTWITGEDGSAFVGFSRSQDMTGRAIEIYVDGRRFAVRLDRFAGDVLYGATGDPRFPPGVIAVESPENTMALRALVLTAEPLTHLVLFPPARNPEWIVPGPLSGTVLERSWPAREGAYFGVVGLHASGRATGCWFFGEHEPPGRCECSAPNRATANCRTDPEPEPDAGVVPVVPDAGVLGDASPGVPF